MFRNALFASLCVGIAFAPAARPADNLIEQVETGLLPTAATRLGAKATILEQMERYGVPGVSIAVIDGGHVAWAKGYGVADSRTGVRVTPETLFQAASISKPLTAIAALAFVDQGKLKLDVGVNQYLKSWKIPENDFTRSQPVTLRMLLSHASGAAAFENREAPGDGHAATLLQILNGQPPASNLPVVIARTPGSVHEYSPVGYDILQQLLTDVGGGSFSAVTKAAVFDPLGMAHSSFDLPHDRSNIQVAVGHFAGGDVQSDGGEITAKAAAGLWSTPTDLATYLIAIQRARRGEAGSLISETLANEMLTPQKGFHGLGPVISGEGKTARFGHDGFNLGFQASMVGYIDGGQGAVVMANSNFAFVLIIEVLESIARSYGWPQYGATNMWPPEAPLTQTVVTSLPSGLLTASTGKFRTETGETLTLFTRSEKLFVEMPIEGVAEVSMAADGKLFCPPLLFSDLGSAWLQFGKDDRGAVTTIRAGYQAYAEYRRVH